MIKKLNISLLLLVFCCVFCSAQTQTNGRKVENFGNHWSFRKIDSTPHAWEKVKLPHTTNIEPLVVNNQWQGISEYKKQFKVGGLKGKKQFFYFEGVMQEAKVFINDSLVKDHKGGFLPFMVDATPYLTQNSTNTIRVVVDNTDNPEIPPGKHLPVLDFNTYGGIYRNVYSIVTGNIYITNPVAANKVNGGGILIHFDSISETLASGFIKTDIKNDSEENWNLSLNLKLKNPSGEIVYNSVEEFQVLKGEEKSISEDIRIENPELWSPSHPNLYKLKVNLEENGYILDSKSITSGIRSLKLTDPAFYLNGKKIFINGTNRHQEYPYVGYAISDEAQYRDAYLIKMAGFNFVRLSHYPQAEAFLKACDKLGIVVMDAIPGWQNFGDEEFVQNSLQNIRDMARRDRNHPSVILWENSLNESGMSKEYMERANKVLEEELPYKDAFSAGWINDEHYNVFIPARQHAKPPFYWNNFDEKGRPILIAEYGDWEYYAQNAGFNQKEYSDLKESERSSRQLRSAGEECLLQQALNFQEAFNSNLKGKQIIGQANWLMFDYNRGYSPDLESSGIADIFRIPKFSYYFYKSQKDVGTDKFSQPMVFIANYWSPESTTKIKVFSNTEEVALYLNDSLIERKKTEINSISDELPHPPFVFDLRKFKAGTLRAVGFINGKKVVSDTVKTPEEPYKLKLTAALEDIPVAESTPDVVIIHARITDKNGTVIPGAENLVKFSISSEGNSAELLGENPVKAEAGIASILIRTNQKKSSLIIKAESESLQSAEIKL